VTSSLPFEEVKKPQPKIETILDLVNETAKLQPTSISRSIEPDKVSLQSENNEQNEFNKNILNQVQFSEPEEKKQKSIKC